MVFVGKVDGPVVLWSGGFFKPVVWWSGGFLGENWWSGGFGGMDWWSGGFEESDWRSAGFMVRWIEGLVRQVDVR